MNFQIALLILFSMFFCHIVDDYYLQGILAKMKQKNWWKIDEEKSIYKNDYKVALIEHGFSWAFVVSIPVIAEYLLSNNIDNIWIILTEICLNAFVHAFIDNAKANNHIINLVEDQGLHVLQIVAMWFICIVLN